MNNYDDIHPTTYILFLLLMASIVTNFVQQRHILQLEKELAPVIIRQNIEFFDKYPDERVVNND